MEHKLNPKNILNQFELIEQSIRKAKLPFEVNPFDENNQIEINESKVLDVSLWHLMKTIQQAENLIKEIGYPRFEPVVTNSVHYPPLVNFNKLKVCDICGDPNCTSDHK